MIVVGRYAIFDEIASGGMAAVHLARLSGPLGFARTVAIKRLHRNALEEPEARLMLIDEARLAARVRHPNVVQTLDIVEDDGAILLVMEYVHGESLSRLMRAGPIDPAIVRAILANVLHGLHAAHEATSDVGKPLNIVHRDVSPQNLLVGVDGVARVGDFGIAKARQRVRTTRDGRIRGKLGYMAPEQLDGRVDRRTDIWAAGVVMWEALTGARLFASKDEAETISKILHAPIDAPNIEPALDAIAMRALERDPDKRFATARDMALAIEGSGPVAPASRIGEWVESKASIALSGRAALLRKIEAVEPVEEPGESRPSIEPTTPEVPLARAPRARRFSWVLAFAAFAAMAGLAVFLATRHAREDVRPSAVSTSAVAPVASSVDSAPPPPPSVVLIAPSSAPRPSIIATPPVPVASASARCDPPYRVKSNGVKVWIPECL